MKPLAAILLALVSGLACIANAANLPLLDPPLQPSPPSESTVGPPDPADLAVDWWRYFEVDGLELDRRIISASDALHALLAGLPEDRARELAPLVERIEVNMDALANARMRPDPEPPKPSVPSERYTVAALARVMGELHEERDRIRIERADASSVNRAVRLARQRIDSQFAAYLQRSSDDPDRIPTGLQIMAERFRLAVAEEQRRLSNAALAISEAKVERLAAERALAVERLMAKPSDPERLDKQIAHATLALDQAREQLVEEQSRALEVLGIAAEDRATARYRRQRVVKAAAAEANAAVRVLRLKAERLITDLLLDAPETDRKALREQVSGWEETLSEIRDQAVSWADASRQEWSRVHGEDVAAPQAGGGAVPLLRVLQRSRLDLAQETLSVLQDLDGNVDRTASLIWLVENDLLRRDMGWRERLTEVLLGLQALWKGAIDLASVSLFKIGGAPVTALGLLQLALIVFLAWWISYWFRRALGRIGEQRPDIDKAALYTIGRLSHYLLIGLGLIIGLSFVGIDFTNFAVVAGAIGIGIGFGLQSIVNNFVSGLILLFDRSLKAGDFVELDSGTAGEVRAINVRSTVINTNDNVDIVVPNSEFISTKVINWTLLEAHRRIHIEFKVAYGTDIDQITEAALEAASRVPHTLKTMKPGVWLVRFGDSGLDYELVVWIDAEAVKRPGAVHAAYMREIHVALRRRGIEIPLPQRDLHLRSGFRELAAAASPAVDSASPEAETHRQVSHG